MYKGMLGCVGMRGYVRGMWGMWGGMRVGLRGGWVCGGVGCGGVGCACVRGVGCGVASRPMMDMALGACVGVCWGVCVFTA